MRERFDNPKVIKVFKVVRDFKGVRQGNLFADYFGQKFAVTQ
jgi:hypothetical protein